MHQCHRTDGWTPPVDCWLQASTATGVAQSIFRPPLTQAGRAQPGSRKKQCNLLQHGTAEEFEQVVAVGDHSELVPLLLLLLQCSVGLLQRSAPHHAAACINPCPEGFAISVVMGPRRVWEAEEGEREGETEEATAPHTVSAWTQQLKQKINKQTSKTKTAKETKHSPVYRCCITNPSINRWFRKQKTTAAEDLWWLSLLTVTKASTGTYCFMSWLYDSPCPMLSPSLLLWSVTRQHRS